MSPGDDHERARLLDKLRQHFATRRSPRATMSTILMLTGASGFAASVIMLRCGIDLMAVRYPLAVLFAWGIFLVLVRIWAALENESFPIDDTLLEDGTSASDLSSKRALGRRLKGDREGRWLDWLDFGEFFTVELEGCLVGIVLALLLAVGIGAIVAIAGLIGGAEALFAELFLDAVLLSAFYKRLRRLKPRWWVAGVLRQTARPVLFTAISLMIAGLLLQDSFPNAHSIGDIWRSKHRAAEPIVPALER